jgi:hypothetical protein
MYRSSEVGIPVSLIFTLNCSAWVALNVTPQYEHETYDVPGRENEYAGFVCPDTGDEAKLPTTAKTSKHAIMEFVSRMRVYARPARI